MDGYVAPVIPKPENLFAAVRYGDVPEHIDRMNADGWKIVAVTQNPINSSMFSIFWEKVVSSSPS